MAFYLSQPPATERKSVRRPTVETKKCAQRCVQVMAFPERRDSVSGNRGNTFYLFHYRVYLRIYQTLPTPQDSCMAT